MIRQWRKLVGVIAVLVLGGSAPAEPLAPKLEEKLPWQRQLQGEDAKQAEKLHEQIAQLVEAGKLKQAVELAKAKLALHQKVQGNDHWQVLDLNWEIKVLQRRAEFSQEQQAEYQRGEAAAQNAQALEAKGRYVEAYPLREQVLAGRQKLLGEEHPYTSEAYNNLAVNQKAQGKYAEAERGYTKSLELKRKLLGEAHPDTAIGYYNLAGNLNAQGKYAEAERGFTKALGLFRELLGEEHPNTVAGYNGLAYNQHAQGKYPEAELTYTKALELSRKLQG